MGKQKFNTLPDYNLSRPLARPKYKVIYHLNNDDIVFNQEMPVDTKAYSKGDRVALSEELNSCPSLDGTFGYDFDGWSLSKDGVGINQEETLEIKNEDIHLYATWARYSLLIINQNTQTLTGVSTGFNIPRLVIPEYFQGVRILRIGPFAFKNTHIHELVIPPSIKELHADALSDWEGSILTFVDAPVTTKYPALTLGENALGDLNNVSKVILPYRWWYYSGSEIVYYGRTEHLLVAIRNRKRFMEERNGGRVLDFFDNEINNLINVVWEYNE